MSEPVFVLPPEAVALLCHLYDLDQDTLTEDQLASALARASKEHAPPCDCEKCASFQRASQQ